MKREELDVTGAELSMGVGGEREREGKGSALGGESEEMRSAGGEGSDPVKRIRLALHACSLAT
jgi:hypothetical protein